jgi:hypothetical protein
MNKYAFALLALAACTSPGGDGDDQPEPTCDTKFYPDFDRDGFGDESQESCEQQEGFIAQGGDCVDNDPHIHPEAIELCDSVDNNCSGEADEAEPDLPGSQGFLFYRDADNDGFGAQASMRACTAPSGYVMNNTDCDDTSAAIHPNATEVCDSVDNDCDLQIDTADSSLDPSSAQVYYRDADNDTYGGTQTMTACSKPSGYVELQGDCNDSDNTSRPGLAELCDGRDNDCDGGIDGTVAQPNRCTGLAGAYAGSYSHLTQEKLGQTVINSMSCSGTGTATLALNRGRGHRNRRAHVRQLRAEADLQHRGDADRLDADLDGDRLVAPTSDVRGSVDRLVLDGRDALSGNSRHRVGVVRTWQTSSRSPRASAIRSSRSRTAPL